MKDLIDEIKVLAEQAYQDAKKYQEKSDSIYEAVCLGKSQAYHRVLNLMVDSKKINRSNNGVQS